MTQARTSIKKVLPAVLSTSKLLKEQYSKPIGASPASLNFPADFTCFEMTPDGVTDPYALLKRFAENKFKELNKEITEENLLIADGGAASMAYARLQFEDLPDNERQMIEESLLRYCELDTLAMVMIMKAWINWETYKR
jgi:hypothetical protein